MDLAQNQGFGGSNPPVGTNMKITKDMIRTDLPPVLELEDGCTNTVLALMKDSGYCETNLYIPRWQVCNTKWYCANKGMYEGWIELENILLPQEFRGVE